MKAIFRIIYDSTMIDGQNIIEIPLKSSENYRDAWIKVGRQATIKENPCIIEFVGMVDEK